MSSPRTSVILVGLIRGLIGDPTPALVQTLVLPAVTLDDPEIRDQDDMCIWIHPSDRSLSTIITSDKDADKLFVYDIQGNTLQVLPITGHPGNIDIRYKFGMAGGPVDIVAVNNRADSTIQVFRVGPVSRQLARVDNGAIRTGINYGSCLYRSPISGTFYAFTTSPSGAIEQYALREEAGQVAATQVRSWDIGGRTEACACDDETGVAYFTEENAGIWKVGAEPDDPVAGSLIARTGDASGLSADVEGVAIYYASAGQGYLLVSSQGSSEFKVYDRAPPHQPVLSFTIAGVTSTDGVDMTNVDLGLGFPFGIITVHNATPFHKTVEVCAFEDTGLPIDADYWDPRRLPSGPLPVELPRSHQLRLENVRPNPAVRNLAISFSLPDERPAALEADRRWWSCRLEGFGPGRHALHLDGSSVLPAGVYLVRLTQGPTSLSKRVVLLR